MLLDTRNGQVHFCRYVSKGFLLYASQDEDAPALLRQLVDDGLQASELISSVELGIEWCAILRLLKFGDRLEGYDLFAPREVDTQRAESQHRGR